MINLAYKDIKHSPVKFVITSIGVGMLFGIVLIMIGVYRGMIIDAKSIVKDTKADLWIVQQDTLGPFAQNSRMHQDIKNTIKVIPGIDKAAALTFQSMQIFKGKKPLRVTVLGYDPFGDINPINPKKIIAGRIIAKSHYEMVASKKLGFKLNDKVKLGRNVYTVVGLTKETVASGGELLIYLSLKDAQDLQFMYSNARIRNDRARGMNVYKSDMVNAVAATLKPGYSAEKIAKYIERWKHKSVYTNKQQGKILTENVIKRASRQIGMFTVILIAVSVIIMALIIYTMTLEKIKEITIMKLIGIPNISIIKMILQETLTLGTMAFLFGNIFAHLIYNRFPKRIVFELTDAAYLFIIILIISALSSLLAIYRVIKADPQSAVGG